jgi:hypothetical protein
MLPNQVCTYEGLLTTTSSRPDVLIRSDGNHVTESACDLVQCGYDTKSLRQGITGGASDIVATLMSDPTDDCCFVTIGDRTATSFQLRTWGVRGGKVVPATRFGVRVSWIAFGMELPRW